MSETMDTLPIEWFRPGKLHNLEPDQVFVPFEGSGLYLAGTIGDFPAFICLRDPAFEASVKDRWAPMGGYVIGKIRFEADRSTAKKIVSDSDLEKGQLVRLGHGFGLCGVERHSKWLVELGTLDGDENGNPSLVAFRRWAIVAGEGSERRTLFTNIGNEVVDGAFDPDVDELS